MTLNPLVYVGLVIILFSSCNKEVGQPYSLAGVWLEKDYPEKGIRISRDSNQFMVSDISGYENGNYTGFSCPCFINEIKAADSLFQTCMGGTNILPFTLRKNKLVLGNTTYLRAK